jgi:ribosomal protein S18 acetylase RimI-like enzyme
MATWTIIESEGGVVQIRPAVPADAVRVRELRLAALAGNPTAFSADYTLSSQEPLQAWIERLERYALGNDDTLRVAEAGGKLVGSCGIFRDPRPKIRHIATIWGVYVDPAWRGLKIGEKLIQACLEWAASHEVAFVRLAVNNTNVAAIQCYIRFGFSVYGVEPKSLFYEGRYYDELLMGCELEDKNENK